MKICTDNDHGEIVYDERYCPACSRIELLRVKIDELQDDVKHLEIEVRDLRRIVEAKP